MVNVIKPLKIKETKENQNKQDYDNLMAIEESNLSNNNFNFENYNFNNLNQPNNLVVDNFEKSYSKNNVSNGNSLNITYFTTSEGTIGVIINIRKEIFEYLSFLQKEIIKVMISPCNFEYEKWRSVRVNNLFYFLFEI